MAAHPRASTQEMTAQWSGAHAATPSIFSASQNGCRPKQSRCLICTWQLFFSEVLHAAERLCLAEVSFLSAQLGIQGCNNPERPPTATRRGLMSYW